MNLHLLAFKQIIGDYPVTNIVDSLLYNFKPWALLITLYSNIPSAKRVIVLSSHRIASTESLMYLRNSSGPNTEPWGTPDTTWKVWDFPLVCEIGADPSHQKEIEANRSRRGLWGTVSKAFCRSKKTAQISWSWSRAWDQLCIISSRAETVDLFGWNPHCWRAIGQLTSRWQEINLWMCFSNSLLRIGNGL